MTGLLGLPHFAARRARAIAYFTSVGPKSGPILYRDDRTPIGLAPGCGWGEGGVQLGPQIAHGVEVPGRLHVLGTNSRPRTIQRPGSAAPRMVIAQIVIPFSVHPTGRALPLGVPSPGSLKTSMAS
jgi:hypothetical protein